MGKFIDLTGKIFGELKVVGQHKPKLDKVLWDCECNCGNKTIETTNRLLKGNRISCTECSIKRRYGKIGKRNICGVYSVKNIINDKRYIGQSIDVARRMNEHKSRRENNRKYKTNNELYREIEEYGLENFKFEILEECKKEELFEKETYWINYYLSNIDGYNKTSKFSSTLVNKKLTDNDVKLVMENLSSGNFSEIEIANAFNISNKMISDINHGRCWKIEGIKYPIWQFYKKEKVCPVCYKPVKYKTKICRECINKRFYDSLPSREELKRVIRCGNFVLAGKHFGISDNGLRKWCRKLDLPTKSKIINQTSDNNWDNNIWGK
jgi:group I intron endonuclease